MTITYTTASYFPFFRLLLKWHGSIWKALTVKVMLFGSAYAILSLVYRLVLNPNQKTIFDLIAKYCDEATRLIPLTFMLGFYVTQIVGRWWNQFSLLTMPDQFMLFAVAYIQGSDKHTLKTRRALARYANLTCALVWRELSVRVRKRFPTNEHLIAAGLITKRELEAYDDMQLPYKYLVPLMWMTTLIHKCEKDGIIDSIKSTQMMTEINKIREQMAGIIGYDWIKVPLIYTQVTTMAVYGYFAFCVVGRQYLQSYEPDLIIPIQTALEFLFYMGWLQVAEEIFDPFGEDEEDFEMNSILDQNVAASYRMAEYDHSVHDYIAADVNWTKLPHTKASARIRDTIFRGHLNDMALSANDLALVRKQRSIHAGVLTPDILFTFAPKDNA